MLFDVPDLLQGDGLEEVCVRAAAEGRRGGQAAAAAAEAVDAEGDAVLCTHRRYAWQARQLRLSALLLLQALRRSPAV